MEGGVVCKGERSSTREEASGFSGVSRAGTLAHPQGPLGSTFQGRGSPEHSQVLSSSVSSKLPAAKPAVFTRTRVVCKPRCQTSCPRDFQLAHPQLLFGLPQEGERRLEAGGASPGQPPSSHPKGRNSWDGQMVHPLFLLLHQAAKGEPPRLVRPPTRASPRPWRQG